MNYVRAIVFILSLLVCCVVLSLLATIAAIANPLMLMLLFTVGLLGVFLILDLVDSPFNSRY